MLSKLLQNAQTLQQQMPQPQKIQPSPYAQVSPPTAGAAVGQILGIQAPTYGGDRVPNRISQLAQQFSQNVKQNWAPYMPKAGTPTLGMLQHQEDVRQFNEAQKYRYAALAAQQAAYRAQQEQLNQQQAASALMQGFYSKVNELMQPKTYEGHPALGGATVRMPAEEAIRIALPTAIEGAASLGLGPDVVLNEILPVIQQAFGVISDPEPIDWVTMADQMRARDFVEGRQAGTLIPTPDPVADYGFSYQLVPKPESKSSPRVPQLRGR